MSWLFGKKKHKESPPVTPPEDEPAPQDEGFIFVEKRNQPNTYGDTPRLYPNISGVTPYPLMPSQAAEQNTQDAPINDLTNIPFQFSKELERVVNQDLVIDKLRLDEILAFVNKIKSDDYEYNFQVERSVVNEMNSRTDE